MTKTLAFSLRFDVRDKALNSVFFEQINSIFCVIAIASPELIQKPNGVNRTKFVNQRIFCAMSQFGYGLKMCAHFVTLGTRPKRVIILQFKPASNKAF